LPSIGVGSSLCCLDQRVALLRLLALVTCHAGFPALTGAAPGDRAAQPLIGSIGPDKTALRYLRNLGPVNLGRVGCHGSVAASAVKANSNAVVFMMFS